MGAQGGRGLTPLVFFGRVMHARLAPRRHRFHHGVYFLRVPLSAIDALRGPVFGVDRFHLLSFHRRDHGPEDGSSLDAWIRALLAREGIDAADGEVWLQCFPRVLGYVFNPVSFWFCEDAAGALRAVLAEVRNTFGERHLYLLAHADQRPIGPRDALHARKVFHVSPFFDVAGGYRLAFDPDPAHTLARVDHHDADGHPVLMTSISGTARPAGTAVWLRAFFAFPWMTVGVIGRIHWHALRLWIKGVRFRPKPTPPAEELTR
jgi:hypothetical protein